jgi:hypothetical protein
MPALHRRANQPDLVITRVTLESTAGTNVNQTREIGDIKCGTGLCPALRRGIAAAEKGVFKKRNRLKTRNKHSRPVPIARDLNKMTPLDEEELAGREAHLRR